MTPRTSQTHPIRVDWLPKELAGMPGRLGMTFAPGKCATSAFGTRWERDLTSDLDRLVTHYEADVLITLLEESELTNYGIEHLFDEAKNRGLDVYWWQWTDGTAPDDDQAMEAMVDRVLGRVYNGERVVVHCRGGLGRTGTLVGCCLRALEYEPDEVFELVRSARAGAIENAAQERYVTDYRPRWVPGSPSKTSAHWRLPFWKHLERMKKHPHCTPREVSPHIVSTDADDQPAILHFSTEPTESEILLATEPTEQSAMEHFAARLDLRKFPVLTTILDSVVDRAVENRPLDVEPLVAYAALTRLMDKLNPWNLPRTWGPDEQEFPHLTNGARRLFLRASYPELPGEYADDDKKIHERWDVAFAPREDEIRELIEDNLWEGEPLSHFEPTDDDDALPHERGLDQAMMNCALRFDGYRYRGGASGGKGTEHSLAVTRRLEKHADYELHCPFDLLTSFFLLQRWLHKWGGEQSSAKAASRRVYLELFIVTHEIYVPRKWAMPEADPAYYLWRWGYAPVAEPYVQMARERLEAGDFEGPRGSV